MVFIPLGVCATLTFVSVALSYCFKLLVRKRKCLRNSVLKAKRDSWRNRRHALRKLKNLLNSRKAVNQRGKLSSNSTNTDYYTNIKKFYKNLILDDIPQQALEESTSIPQQALEESTSIPQQALEESRSIPQQDLEESTSIPQEALEESTSIPQQALQETKSSQTTEQISKKRKFEDGTAEENPKKRRISENNQLEEEKRLLFDRKPPKMANKRRFVEGITKDAKKRRIDDALVKWLPQLGLSQEDKKILESQTYLNNHIVDAAQTLLKSQFKTEGLQSIRKSIYSFDPVHSKSVQLHFDPERLHCFVSSFRTNHVEIADSGSYAVLSKSGMKQIQECYKDVVQDPIKTMKFLKVDKQPNSYDCGVFAIAYAYELLSRTGNPTCKFRHTKMRKHLIQCLEKGRITAFPKIIRPGHLTLNNYTI